MAELASSTPTESPSLLPPVIAGPSAFLWFWALPTAILLALNVQSFALISGNLDPEQTTTALLLGLGNAANLLVAIVLGVQAFRWKRAGRIGLIGHFGWSLLVIALQAGYLWAATVNAQDMLPRTVTAWIFPEARYFFNQYAFCMLPLFFGILRLAGMHAKKGHRSIVTGLLMALLPPGVLYLFVAVVLEHSHGDGAEIVFGVLLVAMGTVMFTGVIRLTLLILRLIKTGGLRGELISILILGVILPLCGLALNRNTPFPTSLQSTEVYALVLINALLLAIACGQRGRRPLLSLALMCATLPYSLYFFLVFLPFTPLAIVAIIAFGAGFLILTPTFLFTLHLHLLNLSRQALSAGTGRHRVWILCLGSFLILPAAFTARALADRLALNSALDYVYAPEITTGDLSYAHSLVNLRRSLDNHRDYKDGLYYPFLSDAYAWLVFDNLVLSDSKLDKIETVFFGEPTESTTRSRNNWGFFGSGNNRDRHRMPRAAPPSRDVRLADWNVSAAETNGASASTATLRLQLEVAPDAQPSEYITHLPLPPGVFVNGFRLEVNGQLVPGRITEKKTALWVYEMIRDTERRDPGLLFYDDQDGLELRVYPVVAGTPSIVEIDFLLPGKLVDGTLDSPAASPEKMLVALPQRLVSAPLVAIANGDTTILPVPPADLPRVARKPYLHLIVDCSRDNAWPDDWRDAMPALRERFPMADHVRVTLANHDTRDVTTALTPLERIGELDTPALRQRGSLHLDVVLARAIRQHRDMDLDGKRHDEAAPDFPMFVVLTKQPPAKHGPMPLATAWSACLPSLEISYLSSEGEFQGAESNQSAQAPLLRNGQSMRPLIAGRPVVFVEATNTLPFEYWSQDDSRWLPIAGIDTKETNANAWTRAAALQERQRHYTRNPGGTSDDLKSLVLASRETGILIPSTSYIVVENQAQWNILEKAEKQKLGQNEALDHKEAPAPNALLIVLPFAVWLAARRRYLRTSPAVA